MGVPNIDYHTSGMQLDAVTLGSGDNTDSNFLVDAIKNPIGAVGAVATDVGASIYNLAALVVPGMEQVPENKVMDFVGGLGLNNVEQYYKQHPEATQMLGLVAGGFMVGGLGSKLALGLLHKGEILATDSGVTISRLMQAKQRVSELAGKADVASEELYNATKALRSANRIESFVSGVGNVGVTDAVFSQSYALKDADYKDMALSMAIGGAANVALNGVARAYTVLKETTTPAAARFQNAIIDNTVVIPHQVRNTLGEATFLNAQGKVTEKLLTEHPDVPDGIRNALENVQRRNLARQLDLVDKATDKSIRVVQGSSQEGQAAVTGYHYETALRTAVLDNIQNDARLAGARNIKPFNPDDHVAIFGSHIEDLFLQHNIAPEVGDNIMRAIISQQKIGWDYARNASVKQISKALKVPEVVVDKAHRLNNTVILDARTGLVHGLSDGQRLATSTDLQISKVANLEHDIADRNVLAGQIQFNNLDSIKTALRAVGGSVRVTKDDLLSANLTRSLYYKAAALNGKLNRNSPLSADEVVKTVDSFIKSEVRRLQDTGMGSMEIALRTHTDYKTVERLSVAHPENRAKLEADLILPTTKDGVAHQEVRALGAIEGDALIGQGTIEKAAALDNDTMRAMNNEFLNGYVAENDSPMIRAQWELTNGGMGAGIRQGLRALNPAMYNGNLPASADFAFRHQGSITDNIIAYGHMMLQTIRDNVKEATQEVNIALAKMKLDPVIRTQWGKSEAAIRSTELTGNDMIAIQGKEIGVLSPDTGEFTPLPDLGPMPQEVLDFWKLYEEKVSNEVRNHINFQRGLQGQVDALPRGIKLPPINLTKKELAYAINPKTNEVTLYHANDSASLELLVKQARLNHPDREIVTRRSDLEQFNKIHDHVALGEMKVADFNKVKGSTTYEAVSADASQMEAFVHATTEHLTRLGRKNARLMNPEAITHFKTLDAITPDSTTLYRDLETTAFGGSVLGNHKLVSMANDAFVGVLNHALDILDKSIGRPTKIVLDRAGQLVGRKKHILPPEQEVAKVFQEFKDRGLDKELPWANQMEALAQTASYQALGDKAANAIATNNFLTSALALRFADMSHALVTMLSVPITTLPSAILAAGEHAGMKHMMEGVFRAYHPNYRPIMDKLDELKITNAEVSETNDFIASQVAAPKFTEVVEANKVFHVLQKPSAWAEKNSRRIAAATAHSIYEAEHGVGTGLSGQGLAFIDTFVKRTMGNYTTAQRPAMFQGTLGAAIGLFQTYMWTMTQTLFRGLESGSRMATGTLLASQAGVFGLRSIPGYDVINHYIGAYYGDNNGVDVTTHIYEGTRNNREAEVMLYGAPSTMFNTALWTRGVVNPRSPVFVGNEGLTFAPAAIAPIMTLFKGISDTVARTSNGASLPAAALSALQLQTLSRPISRLSDIFAGKSIDQRGGTVDPHAEFQMNWATFARAMSSRSLQEQVVRDASYQQSYYHSANSHARDKLMKALRAGANQGDAYREYIALGGSTSGFRSALNKIYLEDTQGKIATLDDNRLNDAIRNGLY